MKKNRIQVILSDEGIEKFKAQVKKQGRSESNLARKYITEGISKDESGQVSQELYNHIIKK
jgi:hypothetical protein